MAEFTAWDSASVGARIARTFCRVRNSCLYSLTHNGTNVVTIRFFRRSYKLPYYSKQITFTVSNKAADRPHVILLTAVELTRSETDFTCRQHLFIINKPAQPLDLQLLLQDSLYELLNFILALPFKNLELNT